MSHNIPDGDYLQLRTKAQTKIAGILKSPLKVRLKGRRVHPALYPEQYWRPRDWARLHDPAHREAAFNTWWKQTQLYKLGIKQNELQISND